MSGEQLTLKEINRKPKSFTDRTRSLRVDINQLISRTRQRNKKQKVRHYIFFSLIISIIIVTGVATSL